MTYRYGYITKPKNYVLPVILAVLGVLGFLVLASARAESLPASGPGAVNVGVDASVWDSTLPSNASQFPIGGSGQINGEFSTAERNGVVVGLRGQQRFVGPLNATPSENGRVGVYEASTGQSSPGRAWWNFDWHVDLRGGKGVQANKTLADYEVTLESNLGYPNPVSWQSASAVPVPQTVRLYQGSFNPTFGNPGFNINAEGIYDIRLVLKPKTFKGPELAVMIQVNVTNP